MSRLVQRLFSAVAMSLALGVVAGATPAWAAQPAADPQPTVAGRWWDWGHDWDGGQESDENNGDAGSGETPVEDTETKPPVDETTDTDQDRDQDRGRGRGNNGWGDNDRGRWNDLAGFAANNGGEGFWVLTKDNEVFALGGAPDLGAAPRGRKYVSLASHPTRSGYWLLSARGKVSAFGAAKNKGSVNVKRAVGMAVHRTGRGYWIAARNGKVTAFGKARPHGDLRRFKVQIDRIVARDDADGYHLRTTGDRWVQFPNNWSNGRRRDSHDHEHGHDHTGRSRTKQPDTPPPTISKPRTEGGVRVATVRGITVARRIADNLRRLLRAADADGVSLGGWGYRSNARQIELRRAHCGTSKYAIYSMPSSSCSPPTARPGHSMHEQGLAIDFYKKGRNGAAISIGGTREFRWLKRNAARFGFYNLPSEPWHWSTNGR